MTRVPTGLEPVGIGALARFVLAKAIRTAATSARDAGSLPDSVTCCGLSTLLSLMDTLAVATVPPANVNVMVHEAPAATLAAQVFV